MVTFVLLSLRFRRGSGARRLLSAAPPPPSNSGAETDLKARPEQANLSEPELLQPVDAEPDYEEMKSAQRDRRAEEQSRSEADVVVASPSALAEVESREEKQMRMLVDLVVDQLENLSNESEANTGEAYAGDPVQHRLASLREKVPFRKLCKLFEGDTVLLEKVNLDVFETRVACTALRRRRPRLELLSLNGNRALGEGLTHVAQLCAAGRGPASLMVSDCGLGDEGFRILAGVLASGGCTQLKLLEVRNNSCTDVGVEALADALGRNSSLESLYLNNDAWCKDEYRNRVAFKGAWALARTVAEREAPLKVSLVGNEVPEETQREIKGALGRKIRF